MSFSERFTEWLLTQTAEAYLVAHGWKKIVRHYGPVKTVNWVAPDGYYWTRKAGHEHKLSHAVNSQKVASANEKREERFRKLRKKEKVSYGD